MFISKHIYKQSSLKNKKIYVYIKSVLTFEPAPPSRGEQSLLYQYIESG